MSANELKPGGKLKEIPVMAGTRKQSIELAMHDGTNGSRDVVIEFAEPEGKGELARLVKGSAVTEDWVDGFLMSVNLAPKPIEPNTWVSEILESVTADTEAKKSGLSSTWSWGASMSVANWPTRFRTH